MRGEAGSEDSSESGDHEHQAEEGHVPPPQPEELMIPVPEPPEDSSEDEDVPDEEPAPDQELIDAAQLPRWNAETFQVTEGLTVIGRVKPVHPNTTREAISVYCRLHQCQPPLRRAVLSWGSV